MKLPDRIVTFSPAQLSDRLGIEKSVVLAAIRHGDLPAIRFNSRVYRITETDACLWYLSKGGTLHPANATTSTTRPENPPRDPERSLWADR